MGCFEAEAFSWSVIEAVHGEGDVLGSDGVETHLLREELADQAIHVLVCTTLPGGIRMSEEEVGIEFVGDSLVPSKLLPIAGRQRVNASRKRRQQRYHGIQDRLCGLERNMGDQRVARRALVNRDEGLFLTGADDQVRLPVAKALAAVDDGWALFNRDLVGNRATPFAPSVRFLRAFWQRRVRCNVPPARLSA